MHTICMNPEKRLKPSCTFLVQVKHTNLRCTEKYEYFYCHAADYCRFNKFSEDKVKHKFNLKFVVSVNAIFVTLPS